MTIYDCFTFCNEDRMLDLRLHSLASAADRFVLVEATTTFTGRPRALHFDPAKHPRFAERIEHVVVEDMPGGNDAWARERHQRNAILRGLNAARDEDWVLISDVDEIPDPRLMGRYDPRKLALRFRMRQYNYFVNNLLVSDEYGSPFFMGTVLTTVKHLRDFYKTPQNARIFKTTGMWRALVRQWEKRQTQVVDGGWHMSWLMTPEEMLTKLKSFSHTEYDRQDIASLAQIQAALRQGRDVLGRRNRHRVVDPLTADLPPHLVAHLDQWRDVLAPT